MNTKFRGKVQMAFASIFPISDKSGVNQKGLYNMNNSGGALKFKREQTEQNVQKSQIVNFHFYKQFWILFKYVINPFMVNY